MESLLHQAKILWPSLIVGMLVVSTHVPLGREVLRRGIIFLDLAIAQSAAFGIVLSRTLWQSTHSSHYSMQIWIAVLAAVIASLALYRLRRLELRVQESLIGILFILSATGSILLLSADPHGGEHLKEILVGQILWVYPKDILILAGAYATVILVWFVFRHRLGPWVFYPLFAVTVTLSTQFVGVYLVFATLIVPSLASLHQRHPLLKGLILGALGYFIGLVLAALLDLPAGASIVWSLSLISALYYVIYRLTNRRIQQGAGAKA